MIYTAPRRRGTVPDVVHVISVLPPTHVKCQIHASQVYMTAMMQNERSYTLEEGKELELAAEELQH